MPRDIPVGNGQMLVCFDQHYQVRDLYFPHVGQENHAGAGPCRFGVWGRLINAGGDRRRQRVCWTNQGWDIKLGYQADTLATDVTLRHEGLGVELRCCDAVDFHRPVLVRRIEVRNLAPETRELRLFHHNDFCMYGTKVGDTAYFDPQLHTLIHYRQQRYLMACWYADGEPQVDEFATGTAGFRGAEGTWRDAEDGTLGGNSISQGAVDSTMMINLSVPGGGSRIAYLVIGCGKSYAEVEQVHRFIHREGPQNVIDRTVAYWKLWLAAARNHLPETGPAGLSPQVIDLYKRSLLLVRSQIDNSGAIIAANDSDIMQFSRDTYSYLWPRDGAFVADALDAAGFSDVARSFFSLCARIIDERGFFLHKYNPDGSPASSWHPWISLGRPQLPIQEDETALVLWALWRHYERYKDIEFVRPLWMSLITRAGDFLVRFRDPQTKLPLPSYDLWEERWGVNAFTVATVYGGLEAAWRFAVCFGDLRRAAVYEQAATDLRAAFVKHLWSDKHGRFLRRIVPLDHERTAKMMAEVLAGRAPDADAAAIEALAHASTNGNGNGKGHPAAAAAPLEFELDATVDASLFGIFALGLLPADDERVEKTMRAVEKHLWCKTKVGGLARYAGDTYHQVVNDGRAVPGNPWFVTTLWLAQWVIARAKTVEGLREAVPILDWAANHALPSGVLAEQVHPLSGEPMSVSPLTWSHASVVGVLMAYLDKLEQMQKCPTCGHHWRGPEPSAEEKAKVTRRRRAKV